jgi:hypothetical protein
MDEDRSKQRNDPRQISDDARLLASVVEVESQAKKPNLRNVMAKQIHDGTTAKAFHWMIVALLIVQYPLGWFIPHIHRGMKPGRRHRRDA